jgi:hypothetical protein
MLFLLGVLNEISGVSRVWQAGHVPWAPLAGGAIWLGALVPMPNQVNKKF